MKRSVPEFENLPNEILENIFSHVSVTFEDFRNVYRLNKNIHEICMSSHFQKNIWGLCDGEAWDIVDRCIRNDTRPAFFYKWCSLYTYNDRKEVFGQFFTQSLYYGSTSIVKVLFDSFDISPISHNHSAICMGATGTNLEMVKMVLSYPDVDPSCKDNLPLTAAVCYNDRPNMEIAEILINDTRFKFINLEEVVHVLVMNGELGTARFIELKMGEETKRER
jgi:hypothetical protein